MRPLATATAFLRRRLPARRLAQHAPTLTIGVVTLVLFGLYLLGMFRHTDGQISAPIDDVYIHFNYARHMAAGHWFEYNAGDGVSTGATSLLWTPLVAIGYLLGLHDTSIIYWTLGLNVCCLFGYGLLLYRLGTLFFDSRALGTLLAVLIMMEGRVLWGFFAGMELGLYHVLLVGALYTFALYQRDGTPRQLHRLVAVLCLLALVRPEGAFLAGFAIVVVLGWRWAATKGPRSSLLSGGLLSRGQWLLLSLPIVLVVLQWLFFYWTTGSASQNGMRVKSHLYQPDQTLVGVLTPSFQFYRDMIFRHFPWLFAPSLRHLLDLFFFGGFLLWCAHEIRHRRPGIFCTMALWFFGGLAIQSVVLNAAYHHGRYQMNYTFIFWFVFVAGIHLAVTRLRLTARLSRMLTGAVMAFFMVMMANTIVIYADIYGKDCRAINDQHVATGRYIDAHLPADAVVGLNDAGAIAYLGKRPVYDVFGLTTNVAAKWRHDGQACLWEQIAYLDPARAPRRPNYFAIYPKWYRTIIGAGFLTEITRFAIEEPNICGASVKAIYSIDWGRLGDKRQPVDYLARHDRRDVRFVDHLDVAYRPDEIAHAFRFWRLDRPSQWGSDLVRYLPYDETSDGPHIAEGGREVFEKEEWRANHLQPDRPVIIVRRTDGPSAAATVFVDGRELGRWEASQGSASAYRDEAFEIGAEALSADSALLRFEVDTSTDRRRRRAPAGKKKGRRPSYRAYYYWVVQPS